jgi:hypothetical protein
MHDLLVIDVIYSDFFSFAKLWNIFSTVHRKKTQNTKDKCLEKESKFKPLKLIKMNILKTLREAIAPFSFT